MGRYAFRWTLNGAHTHLILVISLILSPCHSAFDAPEELGRAFIAPARLHHPIVSFSMPAFLAANFRYRESLNIFLPLADYDDGFPGLSKFLYHRIRACTLFPAFGAG